MQGGDGNRNFNQKMRKQMNNSFADKKQNYSPSTSYNYNPGSGHRDHSHNHNHNHSSHSQQHHPRRRGDRFKREMMQMAEKMIKQNNAVIKLLNDIRDRLPEPVPEEPADASGIADNKQKGPQQQSSSVPKNASSDEHADKAASDRSHSDEPENDSGNESAGDNKSDS
ncbi:MAG: hypothetical protein GF350_13975 [Chitinivibrionales bacterium]|nr:hypothetical protein [Chitinivibrionales bacterium]